MPMHERNEHLFSFDFYGSPFPPLNKKEKGNCGFFSPTILPFFPQLSVYISQFRLFFSELRNIYSVASYRVIKINSQLRKSQNWEIYTCNTDFFHAIVTLTLAIVSLYLSVLIKIRIVSSYHADLRKKSELREKKNNCEKLQLPFFFLFSDVNKLPYVILLK